MAYAIIVTGTERRATTGAIMAEEGERFWVLRDTEGWVPATSTRMSKTVPRDLLVFDRKDQAKAFAAKWTGHPWWCVPKSHQIVRVKETYRRVFDGYKRVP